jgi:phosphoribosylformylglycinamidine synthase
MTWIIEVTEKPGIFDAVGEALKKDIEDLGINTVKELNFRQLYFIDCDFSRNQIEKISKELLVDNIIQDYEIKESTLNLKITSDNPQERQVLIAYNPGVMDPVEESTLKAIEDLGFKRPKSVHTAKRYIIKGDLSDSEFNTICDKLLYNKVIQHVVKDRDIVKDIGHGYKFNLVHVDILNASNEKLKKISRDGQFFLNLHEMKEIQRYFRKLKRNPTDCELETLAQTWSEHCVHKTFKGKIEYTEKIQPAEVKALAGCPSKRREGGGNSKFKTKVINNLLKSTIMRATKELNKPWCVSVFKDNSGVIRFDKDYNICFKVETHNHPSALEPYGGANTGIGGVIRDPLGTGLGSKPILNTDVFCFGPPDYPFEKLPPGTLHPKRIMKGVVSGVRDYGNKMGIPTINGAVLFDERYIGNPLVYCGTVGIMPKDKSFKKVKSGDLILVVGGRTGRDGIHGATFSSGELTHESEELSSGAVQIGNPITEKKMVDTILQARDRNLYRAITDCGAGGLSSAVGEMGRELGVRVDLDSVPLKYKGLSYTEIWISEAQERMVLAVPPEKKQEILSIFAREDVEATIIGEFTNTKRLQIYYQGNCVCDLDMEFLHEGIPQIIKKAEFTRPKHKEPKFKCPADLTNSLKKILSSLNVCSKEWIIRQYDHEVQGGSVLKPLVGIENDGPSDACVVKPRFDSKKGIIVSNGINFKYGDIDPYWMAASSIDEALRQIIAVGGSLERLAILDNFCWGNPDKPDRLGTMVRAAEGCYKAAKDFGVPFISGKDSLNNEYTIKGRSISIPGTLLISAIAVMDDTTKVVSMDLKQPGNLIYIVGQTYDELGGSHYFDINGFIGNNVPRVDAKKAKALMEAIAKATDKRVISSCHDCSEGGIAIACAEMAFSGGYGMEIFLGEVPYKVKSKKEKGKNLRNDFILFSESNSRFIIEVPKKNQKEFEKIMKGNPLGLIGCVSEDKKFKVFGLDGKTCVLANIDELKEYWQRPLRW